MCSTAPAASAWPEVKTPRVVVMGVSGCGKSTIGRALAERLGCEFVEGDDLHPPANVQRMAAGIALTDEDRQGWLAELATHLSNAHQSRRGMVLACSALKRRYRDQLRSGCPDLQLLYLHGDAGLLAERMHTRSGHYMPPSLLPSQLGTLEPPQPDEVSLGMDIHQAPAAIVEQAAATFAGVSR